MSPGDALLPSDLGRDSREASRTLKTFDPSVPGQG